MRCSPFLALESSLAGKRCPVGAFIDLHAFVISIRKLLITLFQLFWNIPLIVVDWSYTTAMEGQNYFLLPNQTLVPIKYPLSVTRISTLLSPDGHGSTLCFFETDVAVVVFRCLAYFTQHRQVHPCGYWHQNPILFMGGWYPSYTCHIFFIYSSVSKHLGFFSILVPVNSAELNYFSHLMVLFPPGIYPVVGRCACGSSIFGFEAASILFSIVVCTNLHSHQQWARVLCPCQLSQSILAEWGDPSVCLVGISLVVSDADHFLIYVLMTISVSFYFFYVPLL